MQLQEPRGTPGAALCFELAAEPAASALLVGQLRRAALQHPSDHRPHSQQHQQHAPHPPPPASRRPQPPPSHDAARLASQLHAIQSPAVVCGSSGGSGADAQAAAAAQAEGWGARLRGLAMRVGDMTQPNGDAPGDATWGERTADVLTSLPFLALGWHMYRWVLRRGAPWAGLLRPGVAVANCRAGTPAPVVHSGAFSTLWALPNSPRSACPHPLTCGRQRLTPEGRQHALSLCAVGAAACAYHATSGRARRIARKVDYWTIALSSSALVKSIYADRRVGAARVLPGVARKLPLCPDGQPLGSGPFSLAPARCRFNLVLTPAAPPRPAAAPACGAPPTCRYWRCPSGRLRSLPPMRCSCRPSL